VFAAGPAFRRCGTGQLGGRGPLARPAKSRPTEPNRDPNPLCWSCSSGGCQDLTAGAGHLHSRPSTALKPISYSVAALLPSRPKTFTPAILCLQLVGWWFGGSVVWWLEFGCHTAHLEPFHPSGTVSVCRSPPIDSRGDPENGQPFRCHHPADLIIAPPSCPSSSSWLLSACSDASVHNSVWHLFTHFVVICQLDQTGGAPTDRISATKT